MHRDNFDTSIWGKLRVVVLAFCSVLKLCTACFPLGVAVLSLWALCVGSALPKVGQRVGREETVFILGLRRIFPLAVWGSFLAPVAAVVCNALRNLIAMWSYKKANWVNNVFSWLFLLSSLLLLLLLPWWRQHRRHLLAFKLWKGKTNAIRKLHKSLDS